MKNAATKEEARAAFPNLLNAWQAQASDGEKDSFSSFYGWLEDNHGLYTRFRSTMGPREDFEQWFDNATGQAWKR